MGHGNFSNDRPFRAALAYRFVTSFAVLDGPPNPGSLGLQALESFWLCPDAFLQWGYVTIHRIDSADRSAAPLTGDLEYSTIVHYAREADHVCVGHGLGIRSACKFHKSKQKHGW